MAVRLLLCALLAGGVIAARASAAPPPMTEGGGGGYMACAPQYKGWHLYFDGQWHTCEPDVYGWDWQPGLF